MSFFKDFLEKRKDSKYGKGHKLGSLQDTNTETNKNSISSVQNRVEERPSTSQQLTQNEASKRAAEAALARQKSKNTPAITKSDLAKETTKHIEQLSLYRQNNTTELDKALKLKEHYFSKERPIVDGTSLYSKNKIYFKSIGILRDDERYDKNEIENRIEMALLNRLDEKDSLQMPDDELILVVVTLFMTANYKSEEKLKKCVELLNKFVENILNAPSEEKFRKIRIENPTVKEKLMSCKFVDMVLTKSGFSKRAQLNADTNSQEDYFVYDGDNLEKLNRLKMILEIAEPIIPKLDRDIKIFQSTSNSHLPDIDLSDEFYNATIDEIKQQQRIRNEALETQGILRTKQMRERDEKMELRLYNYCLIRVRFPDDYILQAVFKSKEKLKDLHELVQDFLQVKSPFEFFGHSFRKSMNNTSSNLCDDYMNVTLVEAGLAPSALINFRYTNINEQVEKLYLKPDIIQKHLVSL